jgi:hypothetical protein
MQYSQHDCTVLFSTSYVVPSPAGAVSVTHVKYNFTTRLDNLHPTVYAQLRQLSTHTA